MSPSESEKKQPEPTRERLPSYVEFDQNSMALINASTEALYIIDISGMILACNKAAVERFGRRSRDDLLSRCVYDLLPQDLAESRREQIGQVIESGKPLRLEDEWDGRVEQLSIHPVLGFENKVMRLAIYAKDVTEFKRIDEDLRREQQRQIFYMESLPGIVFLLNQDLVIKYANLSFRQLVGDPSGKRCSELFNGYGNDCSACPPADVLKKKMPKEWEWRPDKETVFHLYGHPMTDLDGSTVVLVLGIDITKRILAEDALKQAQSYQRAILDNIPDLIWLKDEQGRFIAVNEAFVKACGRPAPELLGNTDAEAWGNGLASHFQARDEEVFSTGRRTISEEVLVNNEDEHCWVETVRIPILDENGGIIGLAGTARDITSRKVAADKLESSHMELEKHVRQRTRELEQVNLALKREIDERKIYEEKLTRARQRADAATRAKSHFLANMSHEIRTPLNVIMTSIDMALLTGNQDEVGRYLHMVKEAGTSLLDVINDILDFSKIEAKRLVLEEVDFDLYRLMDFIRNGHALAAAKRGLELTLSVDERTPPYVCGDPTRLKQILNNLLGNAVKFTRQGGVHISVKPAAVQLRGVAVDDPDSEGPIRLLFSVADTGIGIPRDKQKSIFTGFEQADDTITREFGGTGLGLAICRLLVEYMGGTMALASEPEKGSTFSFTVLFKLGRPELVQEREQESVIPDEIPEQDKPANLDIFVVEDNAMNRELVGEFLTSQGHRVSYAHNGQEALVVLEKQCFDLIVMDIQMPVMDGITATREIRSRTDLAVPRDVPILALTAHALSGDKERFIQAGMDGYVCKPVDLKEFTHMVDTLALKGAKKARGEETSEPGQNPPAMEASLRDRQVALDKLMNNESLLARLEQVFLRDTPGDLENLAQAVENGVREDMVMFSHMLKGTTATIGALRASEMAKDMEAAAREERIKEMPALLAKLTKELELILEELELAGNNAE